MLTSSYGVLTLTTLLVCLPSLPPQTVEHGFPHQPSALGFSPSLQLLAIGTRSGAIKLYPSFYLWINISWGETWPVMLEHEAGSANERL